MKNKKGFTLVELLAVIVVLAIIMIIAIPSVLTAMDNAKKNSFKIFAQRAIQRAMEERQSAEMVGGTLKSCYALTDLKLEGGGKYTGSVKYIPASGTIPAKYVAYIADGTYYSKGKTINELANLNNILESGQTGFKTTASTTCAE